MLIRHVRVTESQQSPSKVLSKSEQSPRIIENSVKLRLLGLSSDCSDSTRTVLTVLGQSSESTRKLGVRLESTRNMWGSVKYWRSG